MIFDTHAHYDDEAFSDDRETLLLSMKSKGVDRIVNVAADKKGCMDSLALSRQYDFLYCSIGIHPSETTELNSTVLADMEKICMENSIRTGGKVVAVGEIGLDYYWKEPEPSVQIHWFEEQLKMARRVQLPVIIHSRDAARDTFEIMEKQHAEEIGGIVHCYSYSVEMARKYLDMGFYFGFGGVVTFKNARKTIDVVSFLPLEKIVLETDSPYLSPEPYRGKRNDSSNLCYVAEKIAQIKGIEVKEVIAVTEKNAGKVYGIEVCQH